MYIYIYIYIHSTHIYTYIQFSSGRPIYTQIITQGDNATSNDIEYANSTNININDNNDITT